MVARTPARTRGKRGHIVARRTGTPPVPLRNHGGKRSIAAMPASPELLIAVIAAMVGGLLVFATLLLVGVELVRRLGLTPKRSELPDGPRYEPPPPVVRARGVHAAARATGERQAALIALFARARAVDHAVHESAAIDLALAEIPAGAAAAAAFKAPLASAKEAGAAVEAALLTCDQRLRAAPEDDAGTAALNAELNVREPAVQAALEQARALADAHLAEGGRLRLLLLVLLLVLAVWLAVMAYVNPFARH